MLGVVGCVMDWSWCSWCCVGRGGCIVGRGVNGVVLVVVLCWGGVCGVRGVDIVLLWWLFVLERLCCWLECCVDYSIVLVVVLLVMLCWLDTYGISHEE